MGRGNDQIENMSFFDHLDELRSSLFRGLIGLLVGLVVCYYFAPWIQTFLINPVNSGTDVTMALLAPTEGFVVRLKISFVAGLFLTAPWLFYQLWRFVAPGLFSEERKMVFPVVFFSTICFITGAAFALYILPYATSFFLSFSTPTVLNSWSLGKYVDFVLRLFIAFGVVFEMPLLIYFLARFGIVNPPFLRTYRRHMYVAFLIMASIITPPDVFTQVILCAPMVLLYELSILLAGVAGRKRKGKEESLPQTNDGEAD